jgi:hypothetical protein|tara:strand:+ start:233 stop:736 length:504 start_codon:yes stop_codon:yes gene_type:complete
MGMFDTIEVHRKLPLAVVDGIDSSDVKDLKRLVKWKKVEFQTKSLDDCLEHYKLSVNGKLYVRRAKYKEVRRKRVGFDLPMLEIDGEPWFEPAPKVPTSLVFYSSVTLEPFSYWVEFEAIFLQGKLHEIKLLAFEKNASDFDDLENIFQQEEKQSFWRKLLNKLKPW